MGTDGGAASAEVPLRKNRDYVYLWSGMAFSVLGSRISTIAYPLLVLAVTGSETLAGLIGFCATIPHLLFALPAGVLIDRMDRKRLMIASDAVRFVALGSLGVAVLLGRASVLLIGVVAFVEGTFHVVYNGTQSVAVKHVLPRSQLQAGIAHNEARERAATVAGQPLGALMFGVARSLPFLFDALSYLISTVLLLRIRKPFQSERNEARRSPVADVKEGVKWLWGHGFLRTSTLLIAGSNFIFQALGLAVIVIADRRGVSASMLAVVLAGAGIGGVLGSMVAPRMEQRLSLRWVVVGANWVWLLLLVPFLASPPLPAIAVLYGLMAFIGPLWNIAVKAFVLGVTPDRVVGRVSSAAGVLSYGAIPLGYLVAGPLMEQVGTTSTMALLIGLMLVMAVVATAAPSVRRVVGLSEASRSGADAGAAGGSDDGGAARASDEAAEAPREGGGR